VGFILDTNTLLLLIVGNASKAYISEFKHTNIFSKDDYDLLLELLNDADAIVTIPQVITETSNRLSKGLTGKRRQHVWAEFQHFIEETDEVYCSSSNGSRDTAFSRLGITDAILAILSQEQHWVVTCDAPLFHEILGRGHSAINFNHEIGRKIL
jgi:hypothetical protein